VANLERGEWILLDQASNPKLKDKFKSQLDILTYTREAADLVGGSKLDRPEDIEIDPLTGEIYVSLTNNSKRLNFHGQILKIKEVSGYIGEKFVSQVFLSGGEADGFSCPDNLAFDYKGNLWFTSDIAGSKLNQYPYKHAGNNGLYMVPRSGKMAGSVIRVASAPMEAELTGPCFSRDYKTLFLSVQHPGEMSQDVAHLTSTWPDGSIPKSAVVTIGGETLQKLIEGSWE
jgi:secreted PhoX family phosphatase